MVQVSIKLTRDIHDREDVKDTMTLAVNSLVCRAEMVGGGGLGCTDRNRSSPGEG